MLYKKFFLTSGYGESDTSQLNAFDKALMEAKIAQCNLVPVSSILPEDAQETQPVELPAGSITHCVLARKDGDKNQVISAGIAWANLGDYSIVAEDDGLYSEERIKNNLYEKIQEMSEARQKKPENMKTKILSNEIKKEYGTALACLIYTD